MIYEIGVKAIQSIENFYHNVAKKYRNTYDYNLMSKNIDDTIDSIYSIKLDSKSIEPNWGLAKYSQYGCRMIHIKRWYFVYIIEGDSIVVIDACHAQNMHEVKDYPEIPELSEFHSWMRRLDEVKGARSTFWCK